MPSKKDIEEWQKNRNKVIYELDALDHQGCDVILRPKGWKSVPMDKLGFLVEPAKKANLHPATVYFLLKDIWAMEWRLLPKDKRPVFPAYVRMRLAEYEQYLKHLQE